MPEAALRTSDRISLEVQRHGNDQKALEAVDKACELLLDQEQKKRALDVIEAGQEYVEHIVKSREKKLTKERRKS